MDHATLQTAERFDEQTLHKVELRKLDDRYVIIIDDDLVFVANEF
ncbi:hypothetical protein [Govanella unica]|uniref:Uncharacterized protein n=1 Tax=Govanella unica TaxID=2975056 RepID=A0A9X3Z6R8_9PROT|nr:hypothetical protein [Govania unica]MDA5193382.1 hypothetical protein [Govania unica]